MFYQQQSNITVCHCW